MRTDTNTLARYNDLKQYRPGEEIYIACYDMNFSWLQQDVKKVIRLWEYGLSLKEMGKHLRRDLDEIAILLMDLGRKGKIKPREGGVYGQKKGQARQL